MIYNPIPCMPEPPEPDDDFLESYICQCGRPYAYKPSFGCVCEDAEADIKKLTIAELCELKAEHPHHVINQWIIEGGHEFEGAPHKALEKELKLNELECKECWQFIQTKLKEGEVR